MSSCPCTAEFSEDPKELNRGDSIRWTMKFQDSCCNPIDVSDWDLYLILRTTLPVEESTTSTDCSDPCAKARRIQIGGQSPFQPNQVVSSQVFIFKTTQDSDTENVAGTGFLVIPSTETAKIPAGKYYYEFKRVIPGSPPDVYTFAQSTSPTFTVHNSTILDV